ncbi:MULTISPECIES: hypothetical protein [Myxococcus]|uniref:hypothetical protein n=1 Tax=Myxococcus TaxID=32 RepID=UPI0013D75657|nr:MULTISPECIES: hypothetical protein [Myxococcus]NVJ20897.1 hypothetical protein [Myxococcus sp. AM011]
MKRLVLCGLLVFFVGMPRVTFAQSMAPPETRLRGRTGATERALVDGKPEGEGPSRPEKLQYRFWDKAVSNVYFGHDTISAADYFTFTGVSEEGKSITAKLLGFRVLYNVQLSLYAAITSTETPTPEEGEPPAASREGNLENFIQAGGNATLMAEVPLLAYFGAVSDESGSQDLLSVSLAPALNLDVAAMGATSKDGVKVGQLGLRFFGQKSAIDNGDIAVSP